MGNEWLQAIFLGIIQGLTEYLPVSSSGHVRITSAFLGMNDPGAAFTAVTQLGTALAVGIYFRSDLLSMSTATLKWIRKSDLSENEIQNFKLVKMVLLATVPISIIGLIFSDFIETDARDLRLVAFTLIFFGLILWLVDKYSLANKSEQEFKLSHALMVGFAQTLALIPGVSRSGATISMARFLGFDRVVAARLSFLLSMPAIYLSAFYEMRLIGENSQFGWESTILATAMAFMVGYITIAFLLRFLIRHTFGVFAAYRVILGLGVLAGIYFFDVSYLN